MRRRRGEICIKSHLAGVINSCHKPSFTEAPTIDEEWAARVRRRKLLSTRNARPQWMQRAMKAPVTTKDLSAVAQQVCAREFTEKCSEDIRRRRRSPHHASETSSCAPVSHSSHSPIPFLELARCATRTKMQFFNEREVKNVSGVLFSLPPALVRRARPNRSPFFFTLVFSPVAFSTIPNPFMLFLSLKFLHV